MIEKLALPEIRELLDAGDSATLAEVVNRWHAPDLAGLAMGLDDGQAAGVLRVLSGPLPAEVFAYLDFGTQERLIASMPEAESKAILEAMSPDDRTALLEG